MTIAGWMFMLICWTILTAVMVWSYILILRPASGKDALKPR